MRGIVARIALLHVNRADLVPGADLAAGAASQAVTLFAVCVLRGHVRGIGTPFNMLSVLSLKLNAWCLAFLTDTSFCGRCGALQGSGAVLWACLHMADASFATVVSHLLVWSSDGSALAGDTRGVSTRGLQHCGQGIWGVSCSTRVFVLNCFPRLQQLICPCMGTDAFSQFLPMLKHAHGLILLAGHPDDHSRKVAQYKAIVGQDQQCCRALPCLCCADPLCNRGSHWCFPDALYILHRYRSNKLGNYLSTKLLCYNVA